ncbi:MAG: sigma-70 family RNA polymerase sigma factor [Spirochaetes bacterium]|nr:sigma-70 family RNA polymerase sigma factor [Spirochaetota bacterium]MBU0954704.1 sigma-70 family RNA polymerase sigma factor [Spirochaetota bacterium]
MPLKSVPVDDSSDQTFLHLFAEQKSFILHLARFYRDEIVAVEDLCQEIFLAAWQAFPRFRQASSFRTWLYRIALNICLQSQRRRQRERRRLAGLCVLCPPSAPMVAAEEAAVRQTQAWKLRAAIRCLPPLDRSLIVLSLDGCMAENIAEISGLTVNAVYIRLHRLRKRLAQAIKEDNDAS